MERVKLWQGTGRVAVRRYKYSYPNVYVVQHAWDTDMTLMDVPVDGPGVERSGCLRRSIDDYAIACLLLVSEPYATHVMQRRRVVMPFHGLQRLVGGRAPSEDRNHATAGAL